MMLGLFHREPGAQDDGRMMLDDLYRQLRELADRVARLEAMQGRYAAYWPERHDEVSGVSLDDTKAKAGRA